MRDNLLVCDNQSICHDPQILNEDNSAIYVQCKQCFAEARIGKDTQGNPEHRLFGEWFKRDLLQPDFPLYYKYGGAKGIRLA